MINPIWAKIPDIERQLEKVRALILDRVQIRNHEVSDLIHNQIVSGGKMLRPACLILFSKFGKDVDEEQIIKAAAAMETLHIATLIHDDVIDDSSLRHGTKTLQTQVGNRNAIYAGDYLLTVYFELIGEVSNNRAQVLMNARDMKNILMGELDQMLINLNVDATVPMYLREVSGKTAQLIELSSKFGAELANCSTTIVHHAKYIGHDIGMAFQIEDDILDYHNGRGRTGKPAYEDLKNGVYSIPLIFAIRNGDAEFKQFLRDHPQLNHEQILWVAQKVEEFHGIEDAQKLATSYTNKAIALIEELPKNRYRRYLKAVTSELLKRNV